MAQRKKLPEQLQEILVEDPLYTIYDIAGTQWVDVIRLLFSDTAVDAYCVKCRRISIFRIAATYASAELAKELEDKPALVVHASCSRNQTGSRLYTCDGRLVAVFSRVDKTELIKIGQFPSRATLDFGTLDPVFNKELDDNLRDELGRAIGLRAYAIGVGSFVYLRRIFEALLEEAHTQAKAAPKWNEAKYKKARVAERVKLLRGYLPSRLASTSNLYGLLSEGLHLLTEEECLAHFDLLFQAIQLILKERHDNRQYSEIANRIQSRALPAPPKPS